MKRKGFVGICILIIVLGIFVGVYLYNLNNLNKANITNDVTQVNDEKNDIKITNTLEIVTKEEKTTPNTLMIYKIYYTKCNHFINEYKDIDISAVNLNKQEIKDINKEWTITEFSPEQIVLEKQENDFCKEHFKLKIENNIIKGIFKEDEMIPSTTEISVKYKINPATVGKGFNILVDEGIIYKKRGVGMFVSKGSKEMLMNKRKESFFNNYIVTLLEEAKKLNISI